MFYVLLCGDILLIIFGDIQLQGYNLEPSSVPAFIDCFRLCAELQSVGPVCLSLWWIFPFNLHVLFFFPCDFLLYPDCTVKYLV